MTGWGEEKIVLKVCFPELHISSSSTCKKLELIVCTPGLLFIITVANTYNLKHLLGLWVEVRENKILKLILKKKACERGKIR